MKVRFSHCWKRYEGIFVLTILGFHTGYETFGLTIFNFAIELEM